MPGNDGKNAIQLARIMNILREYVLLEGIAGGTVDKHEFTVAVEAGESAEESPASSVLFGVVWVLELFPSPEHGPFRPTAESLGIKECPLVVIPQHTDVAIHDSIDALAGIRSVSHDIAKADNMVDPLLSDIGENRLQCLQIAVDVAEDCSLGTHSTYFLNNLT